MYAPFSIVSTTIACILFFFIIAKLSQLDQHIILYTIYTSIAISSVYYIKKWHCNVQPLRFKVSII